MNKKREKNHNTKTKKGNSKFKLLSSKSKKRIAISLLIILILILTIFIFHKINDRKNGTLVSIKSEKELYDFYNYNNSTTSNIKHFLGQALLVPVLLPYSFLNSSFGSVIHSVAVDSSNSSVPDTSSPSSSGSSGYNSYNDYPTINAGASPSDASSSAGSNLFKGATNSKSSSGNSSNSGNQESDDYSKTNVQVQSVDEADTTKTDGKYIYSISEENVLISDVQDPSHMKEVGNVSYSFYGFAPNEILIYNNKLIVIYTNGKYLSTTKTATVVYSLDNIEHPKTIDSFELEGDYYTSRIVNGKLFVISSGYLKKRDGSNDLSYSPQKDKNTIYRNYTENNELKTIDLNNIKYIYGSEKSNMQSLVATYDLNKNDNISVNSYLFNIKNAYITTENIYMLNTEWASDDNDNTLRHLLSLFGFKGIPGYLFSGNDYDKYSSHSITNILKFNIQDDGSLKFANKASEKGSTINQFSLDEYNGNLRVALYDSSQGSKVVVFDSKLNKIGETSYLAKGEKMYSSRFLGNRAYLVTYKTIDPLFAIDLSNPNNPKVMGELKISGYSTYLHPYDENHLIGIGMQSSESVSRDLYGNPTRTTVAITGMKMALFDVSDISNPIQMSEVTIGDSKTTSAILKNHKALLFSKEKEIIAIPINGYSSDFTAKGSDDTSSLVDSYISQLNSKSYIYQGYLVYKINLTDGITLKGKISHDVPSYNIDNSDYAYSSSSYYSSIYDRASAALIRGVWIGDNLFTISERYIKANKLNDLSEISTLHL